MNLVVRFCVIASTSTVTPLSVAHCSASGLIAAARLSSAQIMSVGATGAAAAAPTAASDGRGRGRGPTRAGALAGAAVAPPLPLEQAPTTIADQRRAGPHRLITCFNLLR